MRLGIGIFLGYLLIALLASYFVFNVFVDEIKPSARQAMEDSLVDSANLLAELAADDLKTQRLASGTFAQHVSAYQARRLDASIWGFSRTSPGFRIYITDARGLVQYDSAGKAVGQDYSQWNDVHLTLKGQYGVRSSQESGDAEDKLSVMHVAAPIRSEGKLIGVLTVAKSNQAVEPFIERTRQEIARAGVGLIILSLLIGLVMSYWLSASVQKLVVFAEAVTRGERAVVPRLSLTEIKHLGRTLQTMRERLEGKRYVEEYIWSLTHEMKSPLTAIYASSELLKEPMPAPQRQIFIESIIQQTHRLGTLIEKMLLQARLEYKQSLENPEKILLLDSIHSVSNSLSSKTSQKNIKVQIEGPARAEIRGDLFLTVQALTNLMENAIDFSPLDATLHWSLEESLSEWTVTLRDEGVGIPEFAHPRLFERFFSLPRFEGGPKSTGLGLAFVKQVMELHGGRVEIRNHPDGGVEARLVFPKVK